MNIRLHIIYYILLICFLCVGILVTSPVDGQFSGFTIAPPSLALGYGGFFNPYIFWSNSNINAAAASSPLVLFSPPNFGTFGLNSLLGTLTQFGNSSFNPVLGFGNPSLTFGDPILSFGTLGLGLNNSLGILPPLGFNSLNPLVLNPLANITPGISTFSGAISPVRTAAQSGTWTGTWMSTFVAFPILFNSGPMMLNIVEDPLLGVVAGTTILQGSRYASALTEVAGVIVNNIISLEGFLFTGFDIVLTCNLTSTNTMTGFYTVLGTGGMAPPILDEGIFNLILTPPVI